LKYSIKKIFVIHFEALKGRQMIAQGKAAQQPQPWVTIQMIRLFCHSPPVEANDKKSNAPDCVPKINSDLFYEARLK
jgi:hypothetical protein